MSETYEFSEATPVKRPARKGAGRRPEANPFEAAIAAIAGQHDAEGNPLARQTSFTLEEGETLKQRQARIRRFLTRGGKELAEKNGQSPDSYSIALVIQESNHGGLYVAKFWDRGPKSSTVTAAEPTSGE